MKNIKELIESEKSSETIVQSLVEDIRRNLERQIRQKVRVQHHEEIYIGAGGFAPLKTSDGFNLVAVAIGHEEDDSHVQADYFGTKSVYREWLVVTADDRGNLIDILYQNREKPKSIRLFLQ